MINVNDIVSLIQAIEFYIDDCYARGESESTIEMKQYHLKRFSAWCLTRQVDRLCELSLQLVEVYRRYLRSYRKPHNDQPLDMATIRNHLTAIKTFVKRLYYHDVIEHNVLDKIELPRKPRRLPKGVLTEKKVEQCLAQTLVHGLKGLKDRVICETYYAAAMRRTELANLMISDVDLDSQLMVINLGKGAKDRIIPLSERACVWIAFYLKYIRPKYAHLTSGMILFLNDKGNAFKPSCLSDMTSKYFKRSGASPVGACNLFRHAAATLMLDNDADLRFIQAQLGHADISTTQIYTHVSTKKLSSVYNKTHPSALAPMPEKIRSFLQDSH